MPSEPSNPAPPPGGIPPPPDPDDALTADLAPAEESGAGGPAAAPAPSIDVATLLAPPRAPDELGWLAHYRVLKVLGQGGMGVVFQAEDAQLRRAVALKVILPELAANPTARDRFVREARAAAALKNDHVVTIYQVGEDRGVSFLAMEYLRGETLDDRMARGGPFPWREVARIGREVADGLAAAHAQGMIHRDVKPANIWLEAPAGRVKLLDFGLARAAGSRSDLTQVGRILGTPEFMSPEQARGEGLDARSDLFSLGAVLYALCTGQRPFQGASAMAVMLAMIAEAPRPIRGLNPDVPPALAALVEQLLEKDPARRPGSAAAVRQALVDIEADTTASTASGSAALWKTHLSGLQPAAPRLARPARRRWLVGVAGGIALLGTAALLTVRPAAGVVGSLALLGAAALLVSWLDDRPARGAPEASGPVPAATPGGSPLRIGVLHSRTGTMAISERPVIDAVLLAVEEINAQGGLLGRPVEPVLADGQSDEAFFARQAESLIQEHRVATLFGCWTSASRKAVVPVVERHDHLLFYPVQYEGVERSPNVVYLGPVPNQQVLPALRWLVGFEGKRRWFLVGSDYVFPATVNAVIRDEAEARGCEVVGEEYLSLGSLDVGDVVSRIVAARPDLVVNTINGDTNVAFFRALRRGGVRSEDLPTLSFSISEEELGSLGPRETAGDYVAASYFQSLDTAANRAFRERFARRYGPGRVISAAMEAAYTGVHLWAQAVQAAGCAEPDALRQAVRNQVFDAPQGQVRIDEATLHAVQVARIGRVDADGQLVEVFLSPQPVAPEPFPPSRSRAEWLAFLEGLHRRWGGRWSNPEP